MKRILIVLAIIAIFATPSFAQFNDLTGEMYIGGYLGYSLGMGDAFKETNSGGYKNDNGAGIGLGGSFYYGMQEKMMLGGELMLQSYSYKSETPAVLGYPATSSSESKMKLAILADGLYALSNDDQTALFLNGGIGLYDYGSMKLGLNAGILYRKMVSDNIAIFGMPRFHIVFAESTFELLQLAVGVQFMLGNNM